MIRLTLILAIVIFAILVLVPGEDAAPPRQSESAADRPSRTLTEDSALREGPDGRLVLVTADGTELPIARVIEPSDLTQADARTTQPIANAESNEAPSAGEAAGTAPDVRAQDPEASGGAVRRFRVTGDRVNFRAGPSTDDDILAALTLGTQLELVETAEDGWLRLRVPASGLEGYMSGDFLEPAN